MLALDGVHAHYGSAHVLRGVSLEVQPGQIVCLVGRNGVGKSTTLKTIMGVVPPSGGTITFNGERIDRRAPHLVAARGIAWVPEDRRVFGSLTVEENIRVAAQATRRSSTGRVGEVFEFFPDLLSRAKQLAASLSGGQQQMLAMARAIASRPKLLLLDEPTEGLAPLIVHAIRTAILQSRARGVSILLVEQNFSLALSVGDFFFVLSRGAVVYRGTRAEILAAHDVIGGYLGIGRATELSKWRE
jgi:branched-chain amino acid transport system ATP-binding protein